MQFLDTSLIDSYRLATLPVRATMRWWMQAVGSLPIGVLYYHRVSDQFPNDWTISRASFTRQMDWLQRHFEIIDLPEAQSRIRSGVNRMPAVAITFDDGYAENSEWAIPFLLDRGVPFTYFVTLENIVYQKPFEHDLRLKQPLQPNTVEQIAEMAAAGVEIGGHSRTHRDMGTVSSRSEIFSEVFDAMEEIETIISKPVRYFAFPYGMLPNLNREVFRIAKERGVLGLCSAYGGFNFPDDDVFHIKRFHGDRNLSRLKNWLTYDHRVLHSPSFSY